MCLIGPASFMEAHSSALAVQNISDVEQRNCWCVQESGGKVAQLEALRFQVNRELDALLKLVES